MMNTEVHSEAKADMMMCCSKCGIAEVDDFKLKKYPNCDLVQYCSDDCLQDHWLTHEAVCKERAAELRDEILFRQPESTHLGDCPICFLQLSIDNAGMMGCCSKIICLGCIYANMIHQSEDRLNVIGTCPFCRHPPPTTKEEGDRDRMKRVEANDPVAMCQMGWERYCDGDYNAAFDYLTKAVESGDVEGHRHLYVMYRRGKVLRRTRKREYTIWKKRPLLVTPLLDMILQ